ncbi:sel1 repeat family protein, partial [Escherichia coli]|nr:sel1 repeat family protein [Escherichia coli]
MLTKRILFSVMLIVSPSVVASEKAHELYDSIYGGKPAPDVINTLHKMAESGDID